MNISLWILQGLLAALILATGSLKVFNYDKAKQQAGQDPPSKGLTAFIGLSEMAGALGLVIPWATGVLPVLTPVAAAALAVVMVLAVEHHVRHRDSVSRMIPAILLLCITAFVAWERA
jgi:Flp pilus assembly protein TadB